MTNTITINAVTLTFIIGSLIPFVHQVLVRTSAPPKVKTAVGAALTLVATMLLELRRNDGTAILSAQTIATWFLVFISAQTTRKHLAEPLGLERLLPNIGIS